jgi:hypothetical protein
VVAVSFHASALSCLIDRIKQDMNFPMGVSN